MTTLGLIATLICAFIISLQTAGAYEITHLEVNGVHLVVTNPNNYAISGPINYKAVSVNGDNVVSTTSSCQTTVKSLQSMSAGERDLLNNEKAQFGYSDGKNTNNILSNVSPKGLPMISTKFSMDGSSAQIFGGGTSFNSAINGLSISKTDDNNFSISKTGLPDNIARVFVLGDVVTFVHFDGRVVMKPYECLQPSEQQLIQQLRLEVQQAEQQFRQNMQIFQQNMQQSMQNLHQNMHNMQQNMQQNMQNMQNNMNNRFGNGFPFNNQANYPFNGNPYQGQYQQYQSFNNGLSGNYPSGASWPFGMNNYPFGQGFPFNG